MLFVPLLALAYLLGSIPAAAWVARARGVDIRRVGSGNSGATNVLRSVGKGPAVAVAVFDVVKGALAVLIARAAGLSDAQAALCGVAAVIGHNFSPFLGFRGGKGVATTFGTLVALSPAVGLGMFVIGILTVALTRLVSAGSILGGVTAALVAWITGQPLWLSLLVTGLVALMVWQHRENVTRLQAGNERRLGDKGQSGR
ncbi:glycerol-3-phosphate 1-O-acyltransferase PlsY [Deinococcus sp. MIMF12]|uniref:Glycerol-3-phosphate acyltransferase n=1 Tax=Deinococcus rhizophilus TaxID=3049544 RepID=A0ABT7JI02_9DEIO|nr:glycerol-3-phosphate 1-O-acyltransferase PlsY [Deinococcus rhizophilus]MDL2344073.1 glycerol-3-phosphate 1-O-acyltransferase PlsY [Deinococcus rhizophilus]